MTYHDRVYQEFFDYIRKANSMNCRPLPGGISKAKAKHIRKLLRYSDFSSKGTSNL